MNVSAAMSIQGYSRFNHSAKSSFIAYRYSSAREKLLSCRFSTSCRLSSSSTVKSLRSENLRGKVPMFAKLPLGESHCLEKDLDFSAELTKDPCLLPLKADDRLLGVPGDSHLS